MAAFTEFGDESSQRESPFPDAPRQEPRKLASDRFGLVPTHLARREAACLSKMPYQLITVLGATPNRAADSYCYGPSRNTAATARSRRSIDAVRDDWTRSLEPYIRR